MEASTVSFFLFSLLFSNAILSIVRVVNSASIKTCLNSKLREIIRLLPGKMGKFLYKVILIAISHTWNLCSIHHTSEIADKFMFKLIIAMLVHL